MVLFIAGMDTTAHLLTMTLYNLAKYPHIQEKCVEEIDNLFENADEIEHKDLSKLTYMHQVFKEALRLYNPAPGLLPRVAVNDHKVD